MVAMSYSPGILVTRMTRYLLSIIPCPDGFAEALLSRHLGFCLRTMGISAFQESICVGLKSPIRAGYFRTIFLPVRNQKTFLRLVFLPKRLRIPGWKLPMGT